MALSYTARSSNRSKTQVTSSCSECIRNSRPSSGRTARTSHPSSCAPRCGLSPNPSIERTFQRPLRALWPAAHVERWAPEMRSVLRVAALSAQAIVRFSKAVNISLPCGAHHATARAGCPSVGGQLTVVGARTVQAEDLLASCGVRHVWRERNGSPLSGSSLVRAVRPSAASGRSYRLVEREGSFARSALGFAARPSHQPSRSEREFKRACGVGVRSYHGFMHAVLPSPALWPNPSIERTC